MIEDLFGWADRAERLAKRRAARRRRLARLSFLTKHKNRPIPIGGAEVIDFDAERWKRYGRLIDSAVAAIYRGRGRADGTLPPAPILPFDDQRRA